MSRIWTGPEDSERYTGRLGEPSKVPDRRNGTSRDVARTLRPRLTAVRSGRAQDRAGVVVEPGTLGIRDLREHNEPMLIVSPVVLAMKVEGTPHRGRSSDGTSTHARTSPYRPHHHPLTTSTSLGFPGDATIRRNGDEVLADSRPVRTSTRARHGASLRKRCYGQERREEIEGTARRAGCVSNIYSTPSRDQQGAA